MNLAARLTRRPAPSTDVAELVESFRPRPEVAAPAAAALPAPAIGAPASVALGPDPLDVAVAVLSAERALLAVRGLDGEALLRRVLGLVRAWLAAPSPSTWAEAAEWLGVVGEWVPESPAAPVGSVAEEIGDVHIALADLLAAHRRGASEDECTALGDRLLREAREAVRASTTRTTRSR